MESIKNRLEADLDCRYIKNLSVRIELTQIVLAGNSKTYFVKQLAQTIAKRFAAGREIVNLISVDSQSTETG